MNFTKKNHSHFSRRWIYSGLIVISVLLAVRLAIPVLLKEYINKELDHIPGYDGRIDGIHIALWRGGYQIVGAKLRKIHGHTSNPFFSAEKIDIALDWRALIQRRVVTRIILIRPRLEITQEAEEASEETSAGGSWQKKVQSFYPFQINRFAIRDGLVRYSDTHRVPKINLYFQGIDLDAENISNAERSADRLPSPIHAKARFLDSGITTLNAQVNFLSEPYVGEMKASIRGLALKELNDFSKAYGDFDFKNGDFQLITEMAASKTRVEGYVKTLFRKVEVLNWQVERAQGKPIHHLIWEGLVGAIVDIFKNHQKNQFAARIPIAGDRDLLEFNKWPVIGSILRNAFVKALSPQYEDDVAFSDLKNN